MNILFYLYVLSAVLVLPSQMAQASQQPRPFSGNLSGFEIDNCKASIDLSGLVKNLEHAIQYYGLIYAQFVQSGESQNPPVVQRNIKLKGSWAGREDLEFNLNIHQIPSESRVPTHNEALLEGTKSFASILANEILKHRQNANPKNERGAKRFYHSFPVIPHAVAQMAAVATILASLFGSDASLYERIKAPLILFVVSFSVVVAYEMRFADYQKSLNIEHQKKVADFEILRNFYSRLREQQNRTVPEINILTTSDYETEKMVAFLSKVF